MVDRGNGDVTHAHDARGIATAAETFLSVCSSFLIVSSHVLLNDWTVL